MSLKIYVDQSNDTRRKRFKEKYMSRGLKSKDINELWDYRVGQEDKLIYNQKSNADIIIDMSRKKTEFKNFN